jgi:hypothetical protein
MSSGAAMAPSCPTAALLAGAISAMLVCSPRANWPPAHLPSGSCAANAAWIALAVIASHLARATAAAAGLAQ